MEDQMDWACKTNTHARTHMKNMHMKLWLEDPNRRVHLGDLGVDGRKYNGDVQENVRIYLVFDWGPVAGCCKYSNETSIRLRSDEFLEQLSDCYVLNCVNFTELVRDNYRHSSR
jgi:hypothetical protein